MAFLATARLSPTSRLILNHFEKNPKPQSAIDVSDAVGASYWTARELCQALVQQGHLKQTMRGKSPHYSPTKSFSKPVDRVKPATVATVHMAQLTPSPVPAPEVTNDKT
jgi:DNA-binding IclR family transcriptional regulator